MYLNPLLIAAEYWNLKKALALQELEDEAEADLYVEPEGTPPVMPEETPEGTPPMLPEGPPEDSPLISYEETPEGTPPMLPEETPEGTPPMLPEGSPEDDEGKFLLNLKVGYRSEKSSFLDRS